MPGPFDLDDERAYRNWRDKKLADYPAQIEVVELRDPGNLKASEREALLQRCSRSNMAIYCSRVTHEDKSVPRLLGLQLGLERLDANFLADDDGISSITQGAGTRGEFAPYTDRPIGWHTDGYYNPAARRIRAMLLHCVRDAIEGGESALLDHEIAYILLRDADPGHVRALSAPDALTIPPRLEGETVARPAETGPVFSVDEGVLHMRYTARGVNIAWKDDARMRATRSIESSRAHCTLCGCGSSRAWASYATTCCTRVPTFATPRTGGDCCTAPVITTGSQPSVTTRRTTLRLRSCSGSA